MLGIWDFNGMQQKPITITVITLFPEFIQAYTRFGIIRKAIKKKLLKFSAVNLRDFAPDRRGTVDGRPYAGGAGMVLRPDVIIRAMGRVKSKIKNPPSPSPLPRGERARERVILLTPQGKPFQQADAGRLSQYQHLIFISGRYEGFDERVRKFVDEEISIGDYVLMGGELPALVITEAVLRLIPGILGKYESTQNESFSEGLLEYPQYTKPERLELRIKNYELRKKSKIINHKSQILRLRVPKVLLSGNHQKIESWRREQARKRTQKRRPDLLTPKK